MPTIITRGAVSARGLGFAATPPAGGSAAYIEDYFSTDLYTGNSTTGGTQTITNGLNLSGTGGLVWIKGRSAASNSVLFDTIRGAGTTAANNNALTSNANSSEDLFGSSYDFLSAFNTNGFTVTQGGVATASRGANYNAVTYVAWSFLEKAKFFDVVSYTGNGSNRTIAHNLGSVPGMIIVKTRDASYDWMVYHRSLANTEHLLLNTTAAKATLAAAWNSTTPTSSVFSVGTDLKVNENGTAYIAYLFAHDAGGFGESGNDNVVSCGTFTNSASGFASVNLGYEPQFILVKRTNSATVGEWQMLDTTRGFVYGSLVSTSDDRRIYASSTAAAESAAGVGRPLPTGFEFNGANNGVYVYMTIRRPQKVPTSGSQVLGLSARTGTGANANVTGGAGITDFAIIKNRAVAATYPVVVSRHAGINVLATSDNLAESAASTAMLQAQCWDTMDGIKVGTTSTYTNASTETFINYLFRRAPKFFDALNYEGTGANLNITHNLGVAPDLWIVKARTPDGGWIVGSSVLANTEMVSLNVNSAKATSSTYWNSTTPTSTVLTVGTSTNTNTTSTLYAAYLFATLTGVSKVGTYTGNATTNQINCGFSAGARFVMIKRLDATGDWYIWDTARGIVAGNDPYFLANSTAVEATSFDYIDAYSAGFEISSTAPAAINANNGSFLYLAIS